MTDAELRDAAWAELVQTTIGWLKPNGQPRPSPGTHWKNAKALLDQIGTTAPPPPPPPTGTTVPLRGLIMTDGTTYWPDINAMAQRNNLVVLHNIQETTRLGQLKAANPAIRVVPYMNWGYASDNSSLTSPWTKTEAQAAGYLANYNGAPSNNGFAWLWGCDAGKAGYGLWWAQKCVQILNASSSLWSGTHMDDVVINDDRVPNKRPDGYASLAAYRSAVAAQLQICCNYFRANGKITCANIEKLGNWGGIQIGSEALQPYPDISMMEFYGTWYYGGVQSESEWVQAPIAVQRAKTLGRQILTSTHILSLTDTQRGHFGDGIARVWGEFGTSIHAIQPNPNSSEFYAREYLEPGLATDHGAATGAALHPSTGIWTRSFADGTTVTVNAQAQSATP